MPKLRIMRGISGSGKSTLARSFPNAVVVSRDDLRASLFGGDHQDYYKVDKAVLKQREDYITKVEHESIARALNAGMDVVSDNTNVRPKYFQAIAELGYKCGAEVEIVLVDVPLKTALERNEQRANMGGRDVPTKVIVEQHASFQQTKGYKLEQPVLPKVYEGTPGKPDAILVDIDGTLAHMRDHRGPFDWKSVGKDDLDASVADIVAALSDHYTVIIMSGRDEVCRTETIDWLNKHKIPFDNLFMRPKGDMRKDSIIKAELFDARVRDNYNVVMVFDDRNQVVDMWRSMGLKVAQVAEGDF